MPEELKRKNRNTRFSVKHVTNSKETKGINTLEILHDQFSYDTLEI